MYQLGTQLTVLFALPAGNLPYRATESCVGRTGRVVLAVAEEPSYYVLEDEDGLPMGVVEDQVAPPAEDRVRHTGLGMGYDLLVHLDVEGAFEATFGCSAEY